MGLGHAAKPDHTTRPPAHNNSQATQPTSPTPTRRVRKAREPPHTLASPRLASPRLTSPHHTYAITMHVTCGKPCIDSVCCDPKRACQAVCGSHSLFLGRESLPTSPLCLGLKLFKWYF